MPNSVNNRQETLALTTLVGVNGLFPSRSLEVFDSPQAPVALGYLLNFAGNFKIRGTQFADGELLAIRDNQSLFSILGTEYGGDGRTSFALPNLTESLAIGAGSGPGLASYIQGIRAGSDTFTVTEANLPGAVGGNDVPLNNVQDSLPIRYVINIDGGFPSRGSGADLDSIGMVHKFAGNFAPRGTMFAEGQLLSIGENTALFAIIGTSFGGDGRTTFALPDLRGRAPVGTEDGVPVGTKAGSETITLDQFNLPTSIGGSDRALDNEAPTLALTMIISLEGLFPSRASAPLEVPELEKGDFFENEAVGRLVPQDDRPQYGDGFAQYLGQVVAFAGNFAPDGWAIADGSLLSIGENSALFSIVGNTYGGDGRTTFGLPDLEGRAIVHADGSAGNTLGTVQGGDVTLDIDDIPGRTQDGDSSGNTMIGGNEADVFSGFDGVDTLTGNGRADVINGGADGDILDGGDGIDTLSYAGSALGVSVRLQNFTPGLDDQYAFGGHADFDEISNFENVIGSSNNDDLIGSELSNRLEGGAGNDKLNGYFGNDVLIGGDGEDVLIGGAGADELDGGANNDTVSYEGSTLGVFVRLQSFTPGTDDQYVFAGHAGGDVISNFENAIGSSNNDDLIGSELSNRLEGGAGNDTLNGYFGDDVLIGGDGEDVLIGGAGADELDGGADNDTVSYEGSTRDVFVRLQSFTPGTGDQYVFGGHAGGDVISNFENATGSNNNDDLIGSSIANQLDGGGGNDKLNGYFGDDILIGGDDDDILIGGNGDDLFIFAGTSGSDIVKDFTAGAGTEDKIDVKDSVFTDLTDLLASTTDDGLGNTVIAKSGVSITLEGVLKADLHEDDFVFPIAVAMSDPNASETVSNNIKVTGVSTKVEDSKVEEEAAAVIAYPFPVSRDLMLVEYQGGPASIEFDLLDIPHEFLAG